MGPVILIMLLLMLKQADLLIAPCYPLRYFNLNLIFLDINKDIYFQDAFKSNILPLDSPACKAKAKDRRIKCK